MTNLRGRFVHFHQSHHGVCAGVASARLVACFARHFPSKMADLASLQELILPCHQTFCMLENGPYKSVIFPMKNLHSVRACLITRGYINYKISQWIMSVTVFGILLKTRGFKKSPCFDPCSPRETRNSLGSRSAFSSHAAGCWVADGFRRWTVLDIWIYLAESG